MESVHRIASLRFFQRYIHWKKRHFIKDGKVIENSKEGQKRDGNDVVRAAQPISGRHSLEEWHKILGHVNEKDIIKLEGLIDDMTITSKKKFTCETCILSKQVVPHSRAPDERAKAPLEFVHTDIAGPIEPIAMENFRYAINFVDDYSGACFVYFLRQKSDAVKALKNSYLMLHHTVKSRIYAG